MATDYISIDSSPFDEDCLGVGADPLEQKKECERFIELIRKICGKEPMGARLKPKASEHDAGTYYEVYCYFNEDDEDAVNYAYYIESDAPAKWDETERRPWSEDAEYDEE